jgi:hypothetical protein
MWSVPKYYKEGTKSVESEFCTGDCDERTLAREAKEFPLSEDVARERLVKTVQPREDLACTDL